MAGQKGNKKSEKLNSGQCKNLSKLAQQQESIRKQLQEFRDENGSSGEKGNIEKMIKQMEENEKDKEIQQWINEEQEGERELHDQQHEEDNQS